MEVCRRSSWQMLILFSLMIFSSILQGVQGEFESEGPSESECRPHIEKALKQFEIGESENGFTISVADRDSTEDIPTLEVTTEESDLFDNNEEYHSNIDSSEIDTTEEHNESNGNNAEDDAGNNTDNNDPDSVEIDKSTENWQNDGEHVSEEQPQFDEESAEKKAEYDLEQNNSAQETPEIETMWAEISSRENEYVSNEQNQEDFYNSSKEKGEPGSNEVQEILNFEGGDDEEEQMQEEIDSKETEMYNEDNNEHDTTGSDVFEYESEFSVNQNLETENIDESNNEKRDEVQSVDDNNNIHNLEKSEEKLDIVELELEETIAAAEIDPETTTPITDTSDIETGATQAESYTTETETDATEAESNTTETETKSVEIETNLAETEAESTVNDTDSDVDVTQLEVAETSVVDELIQESDENVVELKPRDHVAQLLKLDAVSVELEKVSDKTSEIVLKDLKKLYENAIKPLETLYRYRDLSNRHFGDSEIFSKPLILFMGPWSGGKSTIINYLLDIEHNEVNLHTGAEPSPAYFNILMYGEETEILDGTELSADYTFSGLQKFGQGLEERLKGYKFPSKLLEKVNIVEIPGILEVRKQVSRIFPFNDACQWFIDRADIIFLIYDPSKLDVGPETEAILDQLKGREYQTRIVLNKADQVKPEELMRVQGALIWNISPLMSSAQPPMMYTTSLWSQPFEQWAPVRLLQAQERAFLRDIRSAVDKRIDNKIASARRFAVRVRNHAKMVDCYLTTYYNHKSVFGNRKQVSDEIINHPQDYHIYEGLSTLTNISRYDLPDPDVYRDFFRLNALYDFQQLSSTCTYFRGCPINRLDVAIAYDLPELVGKHKRLIESAVNEAVSTKAPGS